MCYGVHLVSCTYCWFINYRLRIVLPPWFPVIKDTRRISCTDCLNLSLKLMNCKLSLHPSAFIEANPFQYELICSAHHLKCNKATLFYLVAARLLSHIIYVIHSALLLVSLRAMMLPDTNWTSIPNFFLLFKQLVIIFNTLYLIYYSCLR